jgi:hypothetical protein
VVEGLRLEVEQVCYHPRQGNLFIDVRHRVRLRTLYQPFLERCCCICCVVFGFAARIIAAQYPSLLVLKV